jgi:hypothetical protein
MMATTMRQLCDRRSSKPRIGEALPRELGGKLLRLTTNGCGIPDPFLRRQWGAIAEYQLSDCSIGDDAEISLRSADTRMIRIRFEQPR